MMRRAPLALGVVAAGLLLWWFLRGVDLDAVGATLARVRAGYVAAAVGLSLASMTYRARRWQGLVAPLGAITLRTSTACVFMGWALTVLLPARLGEMGRPVLLGRRTGYSRSALLGTVVLERVLDTLMVLLLLAVYLTLFPLAFATRSDAPALNLALRTGGLAVLLAIAGGVVAAVAARRLPGRTKDALERAVVRLAGPLGGRGWDLLRRFVLGLTAPWIAAAPPRAAGGAVARTVVLWAGICGGHLLLFRAFGLALPAHAVLPLISVVVIGTLVPIPAAVGSYHNVVQIGLTTLLGVPPEAAAGYAIVSHAVAYVPSVSIGMLLLAREGVSVSVPEAQRVLRDAIAPPDRERSPRV